MIIKPYQNENLSVLNEIWNAYFNLVKKLILEKLATLRENEQEDEINNVICCIVMLYVFSIIYSNILNINEKSNEENCRF